MDSVLVKSFVHHEGTEGTEGEGKGDRKEIVSRNSPSPQPSPEGRGGKRKTSRRFVIPPCSPCLRGESCIGRLMRSGGHYPRVNVSVECPSPGRGGRFGR